MLPGAIAKLDNPGSTRRLAAAEFRLRIAQCRWPVSRATRRDPPRDGEEDASALPGRRTPEYPGSRRGKSISSEFPRTWRRGSAWTDHALARPGSQRQTYSRAPAAN